MKNTTIRAAVALLAVISCACAISACGGASGSAQALLDETFSGHTQIESGDIDLSIALGATGQGAATKALAVRLKGPFQNAGVASKLPHFALQLQLGAATHTLQAGVTSTGSALFVQLAGSWFSTPPSTYKALEQGYAQATKTASTAKTHSNFSSLGIEPGRWLSNPSKLGTTTIDGVQTVHLSAVVNIPAFLAAVSKFSQAGAALGLGSTSTEALSPSAIAELAKSIKAAHVDVYTGQSDHLLRRLELSATVSGTPQTQALLGGLSTADVKVLLELSDINKPQTITAPSNPQPSSQLLPALQQLVGILRGVGSGSSTGTLEPLSTG